MRGQSSGLSLCCSSRCLGDGAARYHVQNQQQLPYHNNQFAVAACLKISVPAHVHSWLSVATCCADVGLTVAAPEAIVMLKFDPHRQHPFCNDAVLHRAAAVNYLPTGCHTIVRCMCGVERPAGIRHLQAVFSTACAEPTWFRELALGFTVLTSGAVSSRCCVAWAANSQMSWDTR